LRSDWKKGALPLDQALRCAIEIADALDTAHRRGITHRDLKAGNIMLTNGGAKLLDFGLAKSGISGTAEGSLSAMPTTPNLTAQGTLLGTFQLHGTRASWRRTARRTRRCLQLWRGPV
jgi:serine/threonine protein kinase